MSDPRINLRDPWIAGVLAFLIPGAGHLYQGRLFKAALYFVCIGGTFLFGMHMSEWKAVASFGQPSGGENFRRGRKKNLGFLAQIGVGLPAVASFIQSRRYSNPENAPVYLNVRDANLSNAVGDELKEPLTAEYEGVLVDDDTVVRVEGEIHLEPIAGTFKGTFTGSVARPDGVEDVTLALGDWLFLDSRVLGDSRRELDAGVVDGEGDPTGAKLVGAVPRSFGNWFTAPLDDKIQKGLHTRLGRRYDLALVYTWIAGLLNLLALWDALEGPAYGYSRTSKGGVPDSGELSGERGRRKAEADSSRTADSGEKPELAHSSARSGTDSDESSEPRVGG